MQPTRGIKNCRDSRLFKGFSPFQPLCIITENRPQSANFYAAKCYQQYRAKTERKRQNGKVEDLKIPASPRMPLMLIESRHFCGS